MPADAQDAEIARAAVQRAAEAAVLGLGDPLDRHGTRALVVLVESDPDARVRATALGALVRRAPKVSARAAWRRALRDQTASVRRRAAELAPPLLTRATRATMVASLLNLLDDADPLVAEAAAFALGEATPRGDAVAGVVDALSRVAGSHSDPIVREAAIAALGAIGDRGGLPAVLAATHDRPAIRRRAVVALAAFDGPDVEAALSRAQVDTDWQVREIAEELLR